MGEASDWSIIEWDLTKDSQAFVLEGHEEAVYSLDVFPDGRLLSRVIVNHMKLWG